MRTRTYGKLLSDMDLRVRRRVLAFAGNVIKVSALDCKSDMRASFGASPFIPDVETPHDAAKQDGGGT